jgi:hypothetical protein
MSALIKLKPANRVPAVLSIALLCVAAPVAQAQQVLVQGNVAADTVKNSFGPNRHYFGHFYVGYGLLAGPAAPGVTIRYGLRSAELRGGGRLKIRFTQALAATVDLGYGYLRYDLAQNGQKLLPSPVLHRHETLGLHRLYSEVGLRLNYGRRGNAGSPAAAGWRVPRIPPKTNPAPASAPSKPPSAVCLTCAAGLPVWEPAWGSTAMPSRLAIAPVPLSPRSMRPGPSCPAGL